MTPANDYYADKNGIPQIDKVFSSGKEYTFDWSAWLANEDTEIAEFSLDVGAGLTKVGEQREGALVTVVVDDGVPGYRYPVRCYVKTTRTPLLEDTRTIYINVVAEQ
jgi:hypothetical protein